MLMSSIFTNRYYQMAVLRCEEVEWGYRLSLMKSEREVLESLTFPLSMIS